MINFSGRFNLPYWIVKFKSTLLSLSPSSLLSVPVFVSHHFAVSNSDDMIKADAEACKDLHDLQACFEAEDVEACFEAEDVEEMQSPSASPPERPLYSDVVSGRSSSSSSESSDSEEEGKRKAPKKRKMMKTKEERRKDRVMREDKNAMANVSIDGEKVTERQVGKSN